MQTQKDSTIRITFLAKRPIRDLDEGDFDFYEWLPRDLTVDFD